MNDVKIGLTTHAREALSDRLKVSDAKMEKVARKAWNSKHIPTEAERPSAKDYEEKHAASRYGQFGPLQYRKLMGYIFVFSPAPNGKREVSLVTVAPPTIRMARASSRLGAYRHHQRDNLKNYVI